jgi:hypothetical protein
VRSIHVQILSAAAIPDPKFKCNKGTACGKPAPILIRYSIGEQHNDDPSNPTGFYPCPT